MTSRRHAQRPMVTLPLRAEHPAWSPDGTKIAFVGHPDPPPHGALRGAASAPAAAAPDDSDPE